MDCCNYVQPYNTGTGHFYHQQNFYYENTNANNYAGGYNGVTPASNAIETNVRYNRLPPAYPTDYVYNPKEARLRKAMREQSRELSRQSILQTAIASASASGTGNGNGNGNGSGSGPATSSSFLSHPLQSCASSAAAVSSLSQSNNPSGMNSGRIINPWFPVGPSSSSAHLKPIISPRIMAAHQRTSEKAKEAMRKQVECAGAGNVFSSGTTGANIPSGSGYGSEFGNHNAVSNGQPNDYCIIAEFGDGQKWHPYQNGAGNPYHGGRGGPGMSKVSLHPNAAGGHGPWVQFCGLPLQTSPAQNPTIRAPRQMQLFLHDQQQSQQQHCTAFSTDEIQMQSYVQSKMQEVNPRLRQHPGYSSQGDSQVKSSVSPPQMQQLQDEIKCGDAVHHQSWDSGTVEGGSDGGGGVVNCNILHDQTVPEDQEEEGNVVEGSEDSRQKQPSSKQPLPGFHQAFGSTEIGRFSRSEFFANMVGDNGGNVSSPPTVTSGITPSTATPQNQNQNQNQSHRQGSSGVLQISQISQGELKNGCTMSRQAAPLPVPVAPPAGGFFNLQQGGNLLAGGAYGAGNFGNFSTNFGNVALAAYYNEIRSPSAPVTNPRWHSPYVGVIGSEI